MLKSAAILKMELSEGKQCSIFSCNFTAFGS